MRAFYFILATLGLVVVVAFVDNNRTSQREARFLNDRRALIKTVQRCFRQPYPGLSLWMPKDVPGYVNNLDSPGDITILTYAHSRTGWYGDDNWWVMYRPVDGHGASQPVDVEKLMDFYYSGLEAAGFKEGTSTMATTETIQEESKSWANDDRTLLVTAYVISDKRSGEVIITTIARETLMNRP